MNAILPFAAETACNDADECATGQSSRLVVQGSDAEPCYRNSGNGVEIKSGWGGSRSGAGRPRKQPDKPMHRPVGDRWFAVETRYGTEYRVALDLSTGEARRGWIPRPEYETFLPQSKTVRVVRGKKTVTTVPMIKQIIFVRFDVREDRWASILSCPDVKRIFSTRPSAPAPIPEKDIDWLRKASEKELGLDPLAMPPRGVGTHLRVQSGPFAMFFAVCLGCDGILTRATVEMFGRSCEIELPWADFVDVKAPATVQ